MLQLGTTSLLVEGVEVFPDHADPNQFWYLPAPVSLARRQDGPAFTLITYRREAVEAGARGGGFLMFETALRLEPEFEEAIRSRLAERAPGKVRLSPVQFDDGTVQCVALDAQGPGGTVVGPAPPGAFQAVESILGTAVPSLFGENTAMFSLGLSDEGAVLLKKVFQAGGAPVGVIYRLRFTALRPTIAVRITANLHKVYRELSVGADVQIYWAHVGLEALFQKLHQDGVIKIDVKVFTTDADRDQKVLLALNLFMTQLLPRWFEPSLSPGGPPTGAPAAVGGAARGSAVTTPSGQSTVSGQPVGGGQTRVTSPVGVRPTGGSTTGGTGPTRPGLTPAGTTTTTPQQPGQPSATGVTTSTRPVPAPPTPAPPALPTPPALPFTLPTPPRPMPPRVGSAPAATGGVNPSLLSFKLRYGVQVEDKEVTLEYDRAEAVQLTYAPQGFISLLAGNLSGPPHILDIDLADEFFKTVTITLIGITDFAPIGLSSISVTIRYGRPDDDGGVQTFDRLIDKNTPAPEPIKFFVNRSIDTSYEYRVEYHFTAESGWQSDDIVYVREGTDDAHTLNLDPHRFLGFLTVDVVANDIDADAVEETLVELQHQDPGGAALQTTRRVRPGDPPVQWKVRTTDPDNLAYTYRLVHTMTDGSLMPVDPVTTSANRLLVNDPYTGQLDIDLLPAWAEATIRTVLVDLRYSIPDNGYHREKRIEIDGAQRATQRTWFATPDPRQREFSYRLTYLRADGSTAQTGYRTTSDTLVTIGPP